MVWFLTVTDCAAGPHRMKILLGLDATNPTPLIERRSSRTVRSSAST